MRTLLRLLLVACFGVALARAAAFLGYAALLVGSPLEAYHLEAKSAHLAWRVQAGEPLYPAWDEGDRHVTNFFGPLYFLVVGGVARLLDADLDGLMRVGRLVTLGSVLLAAVLVGVASARREGRFAGAFAGLVALGSAPMIGFGVMTRPDAMADLLGFAGFLLAAGPGSGSGVPSRRRLALGAALLVAAAFAKQTTVLYAAAAVLAVALGGSWRRSLALAAGMAAASAAVVAGVTLAIEPRFAADLLGEAATPSAIGNARFNLDRLWSLAPEMPVLTAVGFGLWAARRRRDLPLLLPPAAVLVGLAAMVVLEAGGGGQLLGAPVGDAGAGPWLAATVSALNLAVPLGAAGLWAAIDPSRRRDLPLAVLAAVQLIGSSAAATKLGADLNYFLGLRLVVALGAGAVWGAVQRFASAATGDAPTPRPGARTARGLCLVVGLVAIGCGLIPGLLYDILQAANVRDTHRFLRGPGRPVLGFQRQILGRAADPDASILTDSGLVQLHQRERAPFVDPWLFRVMVVTGRIDPVAIRRRLEARDYELIVTTKDLFDAVESYDSYDKGLPPVLAEAARRNYELVTVSGGLFLYVPRDGERHDGPGGGPGG